MANELKAVKAASTTAPNGLPHGDFCTCAECKTNYEWVSIPARDPLDFVHPGVAINREHYGPGRHFVPAKVAAEINERLAIFSAQCIRLVQPKKDMRALTDLYKSRGAESVDLTPDNSKI